MQPRSNATIHLATSADHPALTDDDRLLVEALHARGLRCAPLDWRAGALPAPPDVVVIRSCWDYHLHAAEFLDWLARLERAGVPVANGVDAIRRTLHKRYLLALRDAGAATIAPTALLEQGAAASLGDVAARLAADALVVKPAVSLSAHQTWRASMPSTPGDEARFRAQVAQADTLVQAYVPGIATAGELSLVFLGGAYSHCVVKHPKAGDFRVQSDHGGTVGPATPPPACIDAATRALAAVNPQAQYARIDGVPTNDGLLLMEAEVIDPVLFFRHALGAPQRCARVLGDWLDRASP